MKERKLKISFGKKHFSLNLILTCNKYISRWFVFKGHGLQMKNYVCQSNILKSAPIKSLLPECRSVFSIPVYLLWVARLVFLQELLNPVQRVAVIPGRTSRRSRGLGGTSCRSYSSLCLWVLGLPQTHVLYQSWTQHVWELAVFLFVPSQNSHLVFVLVLL